MNQVNTITEEQKTQDLKPIQCPKCQSYNITGYWAHLGGHGDVFAGECHDCGIRFHSNWDYTRIWEAYDAV